MSGIRFTSEFSTYSTSSTILSVLGPDGSTVFENTYDFPGVTPVVGLADILEEDMRRRGITIGSYTIDGEEYDVVYREERDAVRAEDYVKRRFLTAGERVIVPEWVDEDLAVPVYTEDGESCHCVYMYADGDSMRLREIDYPLSAGMDEIRIYTSQLDSRPAMVTLKAGERRLTVVFPRSGQSLMSAVGMDSIRTVVVEYKDRFGHVRWMELPGVSAVNPSVEQKIVKIYRRKRLASYKDDSTQTLTVPGLPYNEALELTELLRSGYVRLWLMSDVTGKPEPSHVIVSEVSGDFSNDPGALNEVKVTYSPA